MPKKFFQLVELNTTDVPAVRELYFQWVETLLEDVSVAPIVTQDVETPGWMFIIVIYDNQEEAIMISELDVTKYFLKKLEGQCVDGPFFRNLETLEE